MKNVPTELLRAFVTVAETQNFTRAGEVLSLTQAAVSMQIRRLEEQIGSALFERGRTGTSLTDEGRFLLSYAKQILQLNESRLCSLLAGDGMANLPRFDGDNEFGLKQIDEVPTPAPVVDLWLERIPLMFNRNLSVGGNSRNRQG